MIVPNRLLFLLILTTLLFASSSVLAASWREQNLTPEEISFLDAHPTMLAGVGTAFPPIMFAQKAKNETVFKGMVSDYIQVLENRLGITIEPILNIPFKEALQRGREKKIDIFPCIAETVERQKYLAFSDPYLSYPIVIITREKAPFISGIGDLASYRIAIVKHLATYSRLVNQYKVKQFNYVFRETIPDILKAVSVGNADACIVNLAVAIYEINRQGLSNLKVAAPTPWKDNTLSMAVRSDWPLMLGIIDKTLKSITPQEHAAIRTKWISIKVPQPIDFQNLITWGLAILVTLIIIGILATCWIRSLKKEIRQRKIAETKLMESEASLILAAEKNGLTLWDWNLSTDCIEYTTTSYSGLPQNECNFKKAWLATIHTDDVLRAEAALDSCFNRHCKKIELEYRKQIVEGDVMWEHMAAVMLPGVDDQADRLLGFFQDITTRKNLAKKRSLSDKLESIGEIASGIAHEMNTPLHYIRGNLKFIVGIVESLYSHKSLKEPQISSLSTAECMEMNTALEECKAAANESIEGVDRVSKIINALKLVAHGSESQVHSYNLKDVIEKALTISENEWKYSSQMTLNVDDHIEIVCNPSDIIQLLTIIIVNAAHAIKGRFGEKVAGKIIVTAFIENETLIITITDNGCGIADNNLDRIFDPFFTTKDVGEGTGQGLYIAFNIAKKYNGTITCSSKANDGTTFNISLNGIVQN
ncbi:transporter substrate-binding domain-containing protein [Pseudodesulfovibrio sp. zrk46]|uniref:ATP-binding protein n=1 Tax=Pseudodesulfovibrio sp. zrk46 TaxID=2725288 RepID=UPI0014495EBA|nr:transporter substrate-binding domain-containing protein [Pseudodesulfovibrio sp. zrk46]QJB57189.1 transporter substrate-binding domain-containing protein [Pseudodesulfovibrio sp. zrk46]